MNQTAQKRVDEMLEDLPLSVGLAWRMIVGSGNVNDFQGGASAPPPPLPGNVEKAHSLPAANFRPQAQRALLEVITARRSGGISDVGSLGQDVIGMLLKATTEPLPPSLLPDAEFAPLVCPLVFDVVGLTPGAYRYVPHEHALLPVRSIERESVRDELLLQWEHGGGAAILMLVVPLSRWLCAFGDHGYRRAALQIGWLSERLYLFSEALGLSYTSSGGFAPAVADELLGFDGYHYTSLFSFVLGHPKQRGEGDA